MALFYWHRMHVFTPTTSERIAMSSIVTQLADLLGKTRRPGDFYARGTVELLPPALSVQGVGPIVLPLLPGQAKQLAAAAEQAPYGRGPDTIIDTTVRNTLQIGPDRIDVGGRHWPRTLATILGSVAEGLGVSGPIEAEFYKMLIYKPGSFFVSHRDTEKTSGMFATLVIALPSSCSGGELVVRHKDRSIALDLLPVAGFRRCRSGRGRMFRRELRLACRHDDFVMFGVGSRNPTIPETCRITPRSTPSQCGVAAVVTLAEVAQVDHRVSQRFKRIM
jgi:2OG-Fe(II) oxygenase superfamily